MSFRPRWRAFCSRKGTCAVVGVPDNYRGEIVHAFVVPKTPGLREKELLEYCAANLARYKLPAHIAIVPHLPKTSVGKIDKIALSATARAQPRTGNTPGSR